MRCNCGELCGHGKALREVFLRDRLMLGLHSQKIREKVLKEPFADITLKRAYGIIQAMESSQTMKNLKPDMEVDRVLHNSHAQKRKSGRNKSAYKQNKFAPKDFNKEEKSHDGNRNPNFGKTCNFCGKKNHVENQCFAKRGQMKTKKLESVYVNVLHQSECRRPTMPVMTQIRKSQKKVYMVVRHWRRS